jgi:hypothetical protein
MARTPHISELTLDVMYPDKFLKAAHLQGHTPTVRIESIKVDLVPMSGGKKAQATVMSFKGKSKEFIVNKTNAYAIAVLLGSNRPADWIGRRIQLVTDLEDDRKTRSEVPCIRILGSPDASPEQAAAYKRAWRGQRKGGALCSRLKVEVQRMLTKGAVAPVEPAPEPEPEEEPEPAEGAIPPEDDWSDDGEEATEDPDTGDEPREPSDETEAEQTGEGVEI